MRIGTKMKRCMGIVRASRGVAPSMCALADMTGPSRKYGYATIHRCLDLGLLVLVPDHPAAAKGSSGAVMSVWAYQQYRNEQQHALDMASR